MTRQEQARAALRTANDAKAMVGRDRVRLRAGELTVARVLKEAPHHWGHVRIIRLLREVPGVGEERALRMLDAISPHPVNPVRLIRELTERQRRVLSEMVAEVYATDHRARRRIGLL